jgi:hypothetical protein
MRSWLVLAVVLTSVLTFGSRAFAHDRRTAHVSFDAVSDTDARVLVIAPPEARLSLEADPGCRFDPAPRPAGVLRCADGLAGHSVAVAGIGADVDVVLVSMTGFPDGAAEASVVTARSTRLTLPGRARRGDVLARYLRLGTEHVLTGLDHVLFLVALFWQAWSAGRGTTRRVGWELARTATGFTVAHSLTLTASVLGWLRIPGSIAEACIAWSLVLVALDTGDAGDASSVSKPQRTPRALTRVALAAAFGLVHGLGFAGALAETRLPEGATTIALVAFNLGVELGQITIFAACLAIITLSRRLLPQRTFASRLATVSAYAVGAAGAALFFQRTASLLGR